MYDIRSCIFLFVAVLLLRCVTTEITEPSGEGNGSETIARGIIVDSTGAPAAEVPVQLLSADYNPVVHDTLPVQWRSFTDTSGEYRLTGITTGVYTLEAGSASSETKALVKDIDITGENGETVLDTGTMQKTATVIVQLNELTPYNDDYVYMPGTNSFAFVTDSDLIAGHVILSGLPTGTYTDLIYINAVDSQSTDLFVDPVTLQPGDTVASAFVAWKYKRQLFLNTTVSGADIPENVYNFPVLVRLDDATFDFLQAQNGGEDIRFVKSDGSPLAYTIERWNQVAKLAEVWVKVDTVYGGNETQYITMYWGNASAAGNSNSTEVFDTANGFRGVWHLDESSETVRDATVNGYTGTKNGDQMQSEGAVGYGQYFDGSGDYTDLGNVCNPDASDLTICAWIKKTGGARIHTIMGKSIGGSASSSYGWLFQLDQDGALMIFTATGTGNWGDAGTFVLASNIWITDTAWHHVAAVIDRSDRDGCRLYIDGSDVSTLPTAGDIADIDRITNSTRLYIGDDAGGGYPWNGFLDECSISFRTRLQDWVKLSYMNQRKDDKLVIVK